MRLYSKQETFGVALKEVASNLSFIYDEAGMEVIFHQDESEIIKVQLVEERLEVSARQLVHALWAVGQAVFRKQKGENIDFQTKKFFDYNGFMPDLSRNGVLNVSTIKKYIRQLAALGHTWFMLYMEDVYEVEGEPYFGALRGRYSVAEIRELDTYAKMLGVELVPSIQTLAHVNQFLMWDHIALDYVDIEDILHVGKDKTIDLIDRMIKTLRKGFSTRRIQLGMDEAYFLGRGNYLDDCGLKDKSQIMLEHLDKMIQICQKYDFEPHIWDDMFFSHYSEVEADKFRVPDEISLMYWDYYNTSKDHYLQRIEQRSKITKTLKFAGGIWRWAGFAPHHLKTLYTTLASLSACKEKGVREIIATCWSDDGAEAPFETSLFGIVLFAFLDSEDYDEARFDEWLRFYTKMSFEEWLRQGDLDALGDRGLDMDLDATTSKYFLYQDPMQAKFLYWSKKMDKSYTQYLEDLSQAFLNQENGNPSLNNFYALYAKVVSLKWDLPLNIREAYQTKDKARVSKILEEQINPLLQLVPELSKARRKVWLEECKPFGLEILEHRFGGITFRLEYTKDMLEAYLGGEIEVLEELEQEILNPVPHREVKSPNRVEYNRALRIMSASRPTW